MPRGLLPTGMVVVTFSWLTLMMLTSPEASFETYRRGPSVAPGMVPVAPSGAALAVAGAEALGAALAEGADGSAASLVAFSSERGQATAKAATRTTRTTRKVSLLMRPGIPMGDVESRGASHGVVARPSGYALAALLLGTTVCGGACNSSNATPDGGSHTPPGDSGKPLPEASTAFGVSVLEHHLHPSRDGFYTDPTLTKTAAANVKIDSGFQA